MNLSDRGTLRSAARAIDGAETGIPARWQSYETVISERQLRFGRRSVGVASVSVDNSRPPQPSERWSLDRDFVVVPVTSVSGARFEWALRESQLSNALTLLGFDQSSTIER